MEQALKHGCTSEHGSKDTSSSPVVLTKACTLVLRTSSFGAASSFSRAAARDLLAACDTGSQPVSPLDSPSGRRRTSSEPSGQDGADAAQCVLSGGDGLNPLFMRGAPTKAGSGGLLPPHGRREDPPGGGMDSASSADLLGCADMHACTPSAPCMASTAGGAGSPWADVPDDILRTILGNMPSAYVRVARLVCRGWAAGAGRLMTSLKPEALDGARLAQRFPYLRSLDLSHCMHSVTFHTLKELQLSSNVTDALVGDLAALTNLRELSLRGCTGLTGAPGCGFGRLAALQHLEVLDVSSCNALQDEAMEVVAQLTSLKQLRMVACAALTDAALGRLATLPYLTHLDIGATSQFTDAGVAALATMQGLQQVSLVSLPQLTNAGVVGLGGLASLRRVTLSKCPHICEAGLQEALAGKQLRVFMCGAPLRRSMCAWMSSVLADLDNLLFNDA